jgi:hypothetical protein
MCFYLWDGGSTWIHFPCQGPVRDNTSGLTCCLFFCCFLYLFLITRKIGFHTIRYHQYSIQILVKNLLNQNNFLYIISNLFIQSAVVHEKMATIVEGKIARICPNSFRSIMNERYLPLNCVGLEMWDGRLITACVIYMDVAFTRYPKNIRDGYYLHSSHPIFDTYLFVFV